MPEFHAGQKVWVDEGATWGYHDVVIEAVENRGSKATVAQPYPDNDHDIMVVFDGRDEDHYVNVQFVTPLEDEKKSDGAPEQHGVWVAYAGPTFTVHEDELSALRWAVQNGGNAENIGYGVEVER